MSFCRFVIEREKKVENGHGQCWSIRLESVSRVCILTLSFFFLASIYRQRQMQINQFNAESMAQIVVTCWVNFNSHLLRMVATWFVKWLYCEYSITIFPLAHICTKKKLLAIHFFLGQEIKRIIIFFIFVNDLTNSIIGEIELDRLEVGYWSRHCRYVISDMINKINAFIFLKVKRSALDLSLHFSSLLYANILPRASKLYRGGRLRSINCHAIKIFTLIFILFCNNNLGGNSIKNFNELFTGDFFLFIISCK